MRLDAAGIDFDADAHAQGTGDMPPRGRRTNLIGNP